MPTFETRRRARRTRALRPGMLTLLLMALPAASWAGFEGIYEENVNRPGGDYDHFSSGSLEECMEACDQDGRACIAFTWVKPRNMCWLKDTLYPGEEKDGRFSGVKTSAFRYPTEEKDTNRSGGDYRHFPLASANPALCAETCQDESRCVAYTYVPPLNGNAAHCWLKDTKPARSAKRGRVSGVKPNGVARRNSMTIEYGQRRKGRVYRSVEMASSNHHVCRQLCGTHNTCEAWNFKSYGSAAKNPGGLCQLVAERVDDVATNPDWISGRRKRIFPRPHHPSAKSYALDHVGVFDGPGFVDRLRDRLNGFQGWGLLGFGPKGNVVARLEDGYAIHPVTRLSPRRFHVDTPTRIGSISKAVTTVAALYRERVRPGFLDTQLRDVIPYRWRSETQAVFGHATMKELLSHRAGLPRDPKAGQSLRDVLADRSLVKDAWQKKWKVHYSNVGFETFNVTLAYAVFPDFMALWEGVLEDVSDADYDETIRTVTSSLFRSYLETILEKADVPVACNLSDRRDPTYLYSENFKRWSRSDATAGGRVRDHNCAQGAMVMTTRELARLFHRVVNTDEILTDREREYLMTPDDSMRLGLHRVKKHSNGEVVVTHNGAIGGDAEPGGTKDGRLMSYSQLVIFPDGYVFAFNANSPRKEGVSVVDEIVAAYNAHRQGLRTPLFP